MRDAIKILHRRYVGDDPERQAALQRERDAMNVETSELTRGLQRTADNLRLFARELRKTARAQTRKQRVCHCGSGRRWLKCCWPASAPSAPAANG